MRVEKGVKNKNDEEALSNKYFFIDFLLHNSHIRKLNGQENKMKKKC